VRRTPPRGPSEHGATASTAPQRAAPTIKGFGGVQSTERGRGVGGVLCGERSHDQPVRDVRPRRLALPRDLEHLSPGAPGAMVGDVNSNLH